MTTTTYHKAMLYEKEIAPLLKKIDRICADNHIPYFFSIATENTSEDTHYESIARAPIPMDMRLTNDLIVDYIKVSAGFEVILPETMPDIEL